jgi:hypothetical protein
MKINAGQNQTRVALSAKRVTQYTVKYDTAQKAYGD